MNQRSALAAVLCVFVLASVSSGQFGQQGNYGRPQIPQPNVPRPNIPNTSPYQNTPYQNTPQYPDPSQGYYYEEVLVCESCNNEVSSNSKVGMKCPHCGVKWDYDTTTGESSGGNIRWWRLVRIGIFVLILLGAGIGALAKRANSG